MHLLADENQHPTFVARLRSAGYAVEWIRETSRGAKDADILRRPDIARLVLITDDRDFGDLIFNRGYPSPQAILYNRMTRAQPDDIANRLVRRLTLGDLDGRMITLTKDGERVKPFPLGANNG